ncbi:MAG: thioredoxin family protein [Flavobacteriales bacterium]|nr:thioredoxin family protein [Flavobacteriales bacterium]
MARTPTTSIPLGFEAPAFALPDAVTGTVKHSVDLMVGGPIVVVFMCNHCPFVVHILPEFVAFAGEYMTRGVKVVAISSNDVDGYPMDSPDLMKALAEELNFGFPYLYDESQEVARAYEAACTPDFSVFDADRKCVYRGQFDGARPGNDAPVTGADIRRVLDQLLAGEAVPEEGQIPSLGCNIKWKPE